MSETNERRDQFIAGLRALADLMEANPQIEPPRHPEIAWCISSTNDADGIETVCEWARQFDVCGADVNEDAHGADVWRMFGGLRARAFYVRREVMKDWDAQRSYDKNLRAVTA